ncbi:hypothetical protein GCM10029963_07910 [Micromonospora andamanensis]
MRARQHSPFTPPLAARRPGQHRPERTILIVRADLDAFEPHPFAVVQLAEVRPDPDDPEPERTVRVPVVGLGELDHVPGGDGHTQDDRNPGNRRRPGAIRRAGRRQASGPSGQRCRRARRISRLRICAGDR